MPLYILTSYYRARQVLLALRIWSDAIIRRRDDGEANQETESFDYEAMIGGIIFGKIRR